ncbi:MAG: NapC/NirT family cytochrome c [Elusimicrobia bacterium]|nr:NapC/NirT family cytochrome c [Elusimicrobiota bacterium]
MEHLPYAFRRGDWRYWLGLGLAAVAAFGGLALFILFGPPRLLAYSESPEFCVKCHNHEVEGEAFSHHGAHRRERCIDCHLPNDNVADHFFWKGIDGMSDVVAFYAGMFTDETRLSRHGQRVLQENCIRCHAATVMRIDPARPCWECHRRVTHKGTAMIRTN